MRRTHLQPSRLQDGRGDLHGTSAARPVRLLAFVVAIALLASCSAAEQQAEGASEVTAASPPASVSSPSATREPQPTATSSGGSASADVAAFCDAMLSAFELMVSSAGGDRAPTVLTEVASSAPSEVRQQVEVYLEELRSRDLGEGVQILGQGDEAFFEADADIRRYMATACGYPRIDVEGVQRGREHVFVGMPDSLEPGSYHLHFTRSRDSSADFYEMGVARARDRQADLRQLLQEPLAKLYPAIATMDPNSSGDALDPAGSKLDFLDFVYSDGATAGEAFIDLDRSGQFALVNTQAPSGEEQTNEAPGQAVGMAHVFTVER